MINDYEIRQDHTVIFLKRKDGSVLETKIDTDDLEKLKSFPGAWYARLNNGSNAFYAVASDPNKKKEKGKILLHRLLTDAPKGMVVDHINHDTLDNTKKNLNVVTPKENSHNKNGASKNSKSGIRGVSWNKELSKWKAQIYTDGKFIFLGYFHDKEEAAKAVHEGFKKHMPYALISQKENLL